jgi:hypothetical protein
MNVVFNLLVEVEGEGFEAAKPSEEVIVDVVACKTVLPVVAVKKVVELFVASIPVCLTSIMIFEVPSQK